MVISNKDKYPHKTGVLLKELEIVLEDITKSDQFGNNSKEVFGGPLKFINKFE